ncbi:MAG: phosphatidylglycerol lysyltransferase domain-containing protein [Oscillospiraceae bacterium]|jgi:hypothetical protein|nr:phosphatidylglycerol lysyltransferase domain-containing protein [Oscillospiraceae bacterium]
MGSFCPIRLEDRSTILRYLRYFPENEGSECTFSNMFLWAVSDNIEWQIVGGSLLLHTVTTAGVPCMMMVFSPPDRLCEGLEYAVEAMRALNEPFRMCSLPDWYVARMDACSPGMFRYEREPYHDDYVYETGSLISLAGRDLHGKRNHINKFNGLFQGRYSYEPYETNMFAECMDAYLRWFEERGESPELCAERVSVERALRYSHALGLVGGVIRVDGKVEAFTLGERITPEMALIHVEKANLSVPGLFTVINQKFVEQTFADTLWINREEDMGLEGLRKAKRSYRPARMIEKYGATLND